MLPHGRGGCFAALSFSQRSGNAGRAERADLGNKTDPLCSFFCASPVMPRRNAHLAVIRPGRKVRWTDRCGSFVGRVEQIGYSQRTYWASVLVLPLRTRPHRRTVPLILLELA